eukprot:CAMPEP_0202726430 /NCGR_PEP_ID=MMETSP1385-20130828/184608_1 /ASSEMBLY_ACC=CAM_ASM_000861 /TAXON_ID=933848 /ORGANISM="Elphidium margaritaceum" /LENGTH=496 /DNA_ID=CAMNT_0049392651 /DNA_START=612 /DNA_END=2102 /DNA_ORIENTATION=+
MATTKKQASSRAMDPNGRLMQKKKARGNSNNGNKQTITSMLNGSGTGSQSSSAHTTPKSGVMRFGDQPLKRKRKNTANSSNIVDALNNSASSPKNGATSSNSSSNSSTGVTTNNTVTLTATNSSSSARPTFQFKIGMQVGVALGDCFLQLQKLENTMDKLQHVSEDITDVMQWVEQMGVSDELKQQRRMQKAKSDTAAHTENDVMDDPIEEVHVLNDNLLKWQKDAAKRMKNVSVTVSKLQVKLEDLDEHHQHALAAQNTSALYADKSEVDKAMETIQLLQAEVQRTKFELTQQTIKTQQLAFKKSTSAPNDSDVLKDKLLKLEAKEKELDRDAEIIATQSEELRKESERLLTERDEVRKQKEQWQKMIDEVKEQKARLEKRETELQTNHKKLLELHETLSEEKKKLHRKAKKIKNREKRLNTLRAAQSQYVNQNAYPVNSSNGSDYAESELTYFSDGDTEIASVNSLSDDESPDNFHKQQLKAVAHLGVPQNPMF